MRGVNLGGWLVLEKWMTPALFDGTDAIDEYTFMQTPGAAKKIARHRKAWITESDFAWLEANGVRAVRIPVGYWIIDGAEPYVPCIKYLDWAFTMAQKYNLQILICLHGAPGSQNGHDHSGRIGRAMWYKRKSYRDQTVNVLLKLATRYRKNPQFWGLELLNEPKVGLFQLKLRAFYNEAYQHLMHILPSHVRIVFHDAFTSRLMNAAIFDDHKHPVAMDIHWYHFVFWAQKWTPLSWYWWLVNWHRRLIWSLQHWQQVIIGEWSGVLSHQALAKYPRNMHDNLQREHITRQLAAYRNADAWFYWTYKTEGAGIWNFRSLVESGRIDLK